MLHPFSFFTHTKSVLDDPTNIKSITIYMVSLAYVPSYLYYCQTLLIYVINYM